MEGVDIDSYNDDELSIDYFTTLNKSNRGGKLKSDYMLSKIDKKRMTVIKKIDDLTIHHNHNKEVLVKLMMNRKILMISKILKNTPSTLTLQGKINLEIKEFSELENCDVVIKVALDGDVCRYDLISYSRRLAHEEKKISTASYPFRIETDPDFLCDSMIILKEKNLTVLKMFRKGKTLQQMVDIYPHRKSEFYREIMSLAHDVRNRDYRFWKEKTNPIKKSIFCNGKWHLVGTVELPHYHHNLKDYFTENITHLIEFFRDHNLPSTELRKTFENIYRSRQWAWQYKVLIVIVEKFFIEEKLSRGFISTTFPRRPRNRKKY